MQIIFEDSGSLSKRPFSKGPDGDSEEIKLAVRMLSESKALTGRIHHGGSNDAFTFGDLCSLKMFCGPTDRLNHCYRSVVYPTALGAISKMCLEPLGGGGIQATEVKLFGGFFHGFWAG